MRYLFLSSFFIILILTGCQSVKPRHLSPVTPQNYNDTLLPTANCQLPTPFTSRSFEKALFKASLDIGKHHLTGLVFVKKMPDAGYQMPDSSSNRFDTVGLPGNTYRIVFSNEFGMTYFDVEVGADRFNVNYCFEPLNKKMLWKIMETDFRLLLLSEEESVNHKCFTQDSTNYMVYKSRYSNLTRWDVYDSSGDTLVEVRGKSTIADPTMITFANYHDKFPSRITIVNPIIKLKYSLSLISIN